MSMHGVRHTAADQANMDFASLAADVDVFTHDINVHKDKNAHEKGKAQLREDRQS